MNDRNTLPITITHYGVVCTCITLQGRHSLLRMAESHSRLMVFFQGRRQRVKLIYLRWERVIEGKHFTNVL